MSSPTPYESTILSFRHPLEKHKLAEIFKTVTQLLEEKNLLLRAGTIVDATLIAALSSTGFQGASKRADAPDDFTWHIAMKRHQRKALNPLCPIDALQERFEQGKAKIRAKVENPFRVIKRQFGHVKVRYRDLRKNTQQLHTLFALANLWMARGRLLKAGENMT